jgi:hypothetical protein
MPMRLFILGLWVISAIACSPAVSKNGYTADFLAHVKSNCSSKDINCECVLTQMVQRWPTENDAYAATRQQREPRGETDVVNFVISALKAQCSK